MAEAQGLGPCQCGFESHRPHNLISQYVRMTPNPRSADSGFAFLAGPLGLAGGLAVTAGLKQVAQRFADGGAMSCQGPVPAVMPRP